MHLKCRRTGFSIVEFLLVIAIIVILYLSAAPAFRSYRYINLDMVARKIATDLQYARALSISQPLNASNNPVRAGAFFPQSQSYSIFLENSLSTVDDPLRPGSKLGVYLSYGDYKDIQLLGTVSGGADTSEKLVVFDAKGRPCSFSGTLWNNNGQISLQTSNNIKRLIIVEANSGRIYITF
jgi:type II secretory pathway pseudopilin PulG